jgi:hypothetical protein
VAIAVVVTAITVIAAVAPVTIPFFVATIPLATIPSIKHTVSVVRVVGAHSFRVTVAIVIGAT